MSWLSKAFRMVFRAVQRIWDRVSPKVVSDFERFVEEFSDVALQAVREQALLTLTGQQKLSNAAEIVMGVAKARGWKVLETAAITLVQDVYTATKAELVPLVALPGDDKTAALIEGRQR